MARLIETLRREHRDAAVLLQALERQIDIFEAAGEPDYDVVTGIVDYFLDFPDKRHHPKEERLLAQLDARNATVREMAADLRREHQALAVALLRIRTMLNEILQGSDLPRSALAEAARAFIADQRHHMLDEDDRLFAIAERALTAGDWRELERDDDSSADPMSGLSAEAGYAAVRERLLAWARDFG